MKKRLLILALLSLAACASSPAKKEPRPLSKKESARAAWRDAMGNVRTPKPGCWQAAYPSMKWKRVKCGRGTKRHLDIGGFAGDAQIMSSAFISTATGKISFANASILGVTADYQACPTPPISPTSIAQAKVWGFQLNSNVFNDPFPTIVPGDAQDCSIPGKCTGWVQFTAGGGGLIGPDTQAASIEYWLFSADPNANINCPVKSMGDPDWDKGQPSFWVQIGSQSCVVNSGNVYIPGFDASQLDKFALSGSSDGELDQVTVVFDGMSYAHSLPTFMKINQRWNSAEFNVFGTNNGKCAVFGPNSTLTIVDTITGPNGASLKASCGPKVSLTLEKNNLSFGDPGQCQCFAKDDTITFTESNAASPHCACPAGAAWNATDTKCECAAPGMTQDPKTGECSCPIPGQELFKGACACPQGQILTKYKTCGCPAGTSYSTKLQRCVIEKSCPANCPYGCVIPKETFPGEPIRPSSNWRCLPGPGSPGEPKYPPTHTVQ